jgi:DNA-directed RNA polymerase subunit K/omega
MYEYIQLYTMDGDDNTDEVVSDVEIENSDVNEEVDGVDGVDDGNDEGVDGIYEEGNEEGNGVDDGEDIEDTIDGDDDGADEGADEGVGDGAGVGVGVGADADADIDDVDCKDSINNEYSKEIIIVKEENKITSDVLTKFEITELVSIRATQIERRADCMIDTTGMTDPIVMARRELMARRSPLAIRRYVGDRCTLVDGKKQVSQYYEVWNPNTMVFAVTFD